MKKTVSFIVALVLSLTALIGVFAFMPEQAHAASQSDLTFTKNSDGVSYSVTDCNTSASGALEIPSTYDGLPVTSIGDWAFAFCESLTAITIPDSVTSIGDSAFYFCTGLTAITIPNGVTSIGGSAFYGCESLTEITIPNGATSIGECAFYACDSLTEITIPNSVTSIGDHAFEYCSSLDTVFYGGTEAQKNAIAISGGNEDLLNVTWYYEDETTPTATPTVAPTETPAETPEVSDQTSDVQWWLIAIICVIVICVGVVIGIICVIVICVGVVIGILIKKKK